MPKELLPLNTPAQREIFAIVLDKLLEKGDPASVNLGVNMLLLAAPGIEKAWKAEQKKKRKKKPQEFSQV